LLRSARISSVVFWVILIYLSDCFDLHPPLSGNITRIFPFFEESTNLTLGKMQAGINMTKANPKKKPSKRSLFALSPLFLAVFVVGWIKTWIGQLGKQQKQTQLYQKLCHIKFANKSLIQKPS
jgi:hypothetical protein